MTELWFEVKLESDVVITADSATAGGHNGLDYLPGSLFMGSLIAKLVSEGKKFDAEKFLGGSIRFLDGYPAIDGSRTFPVPISYHRKKLEGWDNTKPIIPHIGQEGEGGQLKQWRSGYMLGTGEVIDEIKMQYRLKTAIDREKGRSKDAQLFGYESIPAGSIYIMGVQCDGDDDAEMISKNLKDQHIRLGRSRSAEYGSAVICEREVPAEEKYSDIKENKVSFYLKSDLLLFRDGVPVLCPQAKDFFLPDSSRIIQEETFIRVRKYSPWNSFFRTRMAERQVICKGSVIVFSCAEKLNLKEIRLKLSSGIGIHREEGLGQISVNLDLVNNPPKLKKYEQTFFSASDGVKDNDTLLNYLKNKAETKKAKYKTYEEGLRFADEIISFSNKLDKAPGKSQWGEIRKRTLSCLENPEKLNGKLKDFCKEGMRKEIWDHNEKASIYNKITQKLGQNSDKSKCMVLYHAACTMQRKLKEGKK